MVQKIVVVGHSGLAAVLGCQQAQLIAAPDDMSLRDAVSAAVADGTPPAGVGLVFPWDVIENSGGVAQQLMSLQYRVVVVVDDPSVDPAAFAGVPVAGPDSTVDSLAALLTQVMGVAVFEADAGPAPAAPDYPQPSYEQPQYTQPQYEQPTYEPPVYEAPQPQYDPYAQPQQPQQPQYEPPVYEAPQAPQPQPDPFAQPVYEAPQPSYDPYAPQQPQPTYDAPQPQYAADPYAAPQQPTFDTGFNEPVVAEPEEDAPWNTTWNAEPAEPTEPVYAPPQPDPFAPVAQIPEVTQDPFTPPAAPQSPYQPDPFAQPAPQQQPPAGDPFAPPPAPQQPPAFDPYAAPPAPDPHQSSPPPSDPFTPQPVQPQPDPFAPPATPPVIPPPTQPDPFAAPAPQPPSDPFAPPPAPVTPSMPPAAPQNPYQPDPYRQDPFAPPAAPPQPDPFTQPAPQQQPPAGDPYAAPPAPTGAPQQDPFAAPLAAPQSPHQPEPYRPDPFAAPPATQQADPFAAPPRPTPPPVPQDPFAQSAQPVQSYGHGPSTDFGGTMQAPQRMRRAQVHTFAVPKGGTGKSSLAAIYAAVMSQGLRSGLDDNEPGPRVLLIDANVQQADSRRIMGLRPQRTILDLARTVFDENTIESYLTPPSPANPMWLLAGPLNKAEADPQLITPALYRRATDLLLSRFDHIVIDTPEARLYDPMLADYAMPITDWLIVPVLQNRPVLDGTKEWLQLIQAPRHVGGYAFDPSKVRLVMNMVRDAVGYKPEALSVDLAAWEFAGQVAYSDEVARATNEYRLPLNDKPLVDSVRNVLYSVTGNPVFNAIDGDAGKAKRGKVKGGNAVGFIKKMMS
jgi:cellulose biosynthesis protein BcsQ